MQLPLCDPADKLAIALNSYIVSLTPAAEALAPRLSLRQYATAAHSDALHDATALFYRLHITAAALVRLHAAYVEATATLADFADTYAADLQAYDQERGDLRAALAPLFASLTTSHEAIGSTNPELIYAAADWCKQANTLSKRLGLPGIPARRFGDKAKQPNLTAHHTVVAVLREGEILAADFLAAESSASYLHLLKRLTQMQQLKKMGVLV